MSQIRSRSLLAGATVLFLLPLGEFERVSKLARLWAVEGAGLCFDGFPAKIFNACFAASCSASFFVLTVPCTSCTQKFITHPARHLHTSLMKLWCEASSLVDCSGVLLLSTQMESALRTMKTWCEAMMGVNPTLGCEVGQAYGRVSSPAL